MKTQMAGECVQKSYCEKVLKQEWRSEHSIQKETNVVYVPKI